MPYRVECGIVTCRFNDPFSKNYGWCMNPDNIVLKWRMAGDFGKGNIVFMECLQMDIPVRAIEDANNKSEQPA